jgi:hypothetical protein
VGDADDLDIEAQVRAWVAGEITRQRFGDTIRYALSWHRVTVPTPSGPAYQVSWEIVVTMPSGLPARPLVKTLELISATPPEQAVRDRVAAAVAELRQARAAVLSLPARPVAGDVPVSLPGGLVQGRG